MRHHDVLEIAASVAILFLAACGPASTVAPAPQLSAQPMVLPVAQSNNAVAIATVSGEPVLYSFNGLGAGKTHSDVGHMGFACLLQTGVCNQIEDVPVAEGRLASSAVTVGNVVYLFGGYSVAEDGTEVSTPDVLTFDPATEEYTRRADMPVPVDDAVLFTYLDRYIYLVSGWHDTGNVSLVQVYDTETDTWAQATDYPGSPVFGHSGGAVGAEFVIADGVAVVGEVDGRRQFGEVDEVWHGAIDPEDYLQINWTPLPQHPFGPLYRMAATGSAARGQIVFAGGGDNPYNINGVGYDGVDAKASNKAFAYDFAKKNWTNFRSIDEASMDHRGLLEHDGTFYIVGGLDSALNVRDGVSAFKLKD